MEFGCLTDDPSIGSVFGIVLCLLHFSLTLCFIGESILLWCIHFSLNEDFTN